MDEGEVERQIDQMVRFIRQEAEEKAAEIAVTAEEEFNIEKLTLLDAEKARVAREFERRDAAVEVKKKIERSKQVNESRLKVLRAREEALASALSAAKAAAAQRASADPSKYKSLLVDLALQAVHKLGEPEAVLVGRKCDAALLPEVAAAASEKFESTFGKKAPKISAASGTTDADFLPPPPSEAGEGAPSCAGGVVARTPDGRISCSNTLDARLAIAYAQKLPEIRASLFGEA